MIRRLSRGEVENLLNMKLFDWQWERIAPSMRYDDKEPKMGHEWCVDYNKHQHELTILQDKIDALTPKKRRFWMSKNKKVKASEKTQLLILKKIIEPNTRSEELPLVTTEAVAVRADAIDLIEPATYASGFVFQQPESTGNPRDSYFLSRNMYDAFLGRTYWKPTAEEECVRVWIAGGPDYLVKGNVYELKDRIEGARG